MPAARRDKLDFADLRKAYRNNQNILRLLRGVDEQPNDQHAILASYDLQAGSYVAMLAEPATAALHREFTAAIAAVLDSLDADSLLEAGVGEATTLVPVVQQLRSPRLEIRGQVLGFDLSWSRVHAGLKYCRAHTGFPVRLFVGELEAVALPDNSVDVVFTSHAVEPNHGRERPILRELMRVAGRYVVLFEPGYEFAASEAKSYMEYHGYCRGLKTIADEEGWPVVEHRLLGCAMNPRNPTAVLVLEKTADRGAATEPICACPVCHGTLVLVDGAYFCEHDGLAYPILRGIPCLARNNGIVASHYLNDS